MTVLQMLEKAVRFSPEQIATIWDDRRRTWREVGERVSRAATGLRALGVTDGDRVAVLSMNSDIYVELFFSVGWAGGVIVPLNTRWSVRELADALTDCEPTLLLVDENFRPLIGQVLDGTLWRPRLVMIEPNEPAGDDIRVLNGGRAPISYESLISDHEAGPPSDRRGDDLYSICYTGGTTGRSRGVMLSHRNFVTSSILWIATLDFRPTTRYLHSVGFFHLAGSAPLLALTMVGGTHVLAPKFDAGAILETMERQQVNYALFVPTMISMLLNHADFDSTDLSCLRDIEYGASPMPTGLLQEALRRIPGVSFRQGYGCTEATALIACLQAEHHKVGGMDPRLATAAGRAVMGVEIRVVDAAGVELPAGEVGEIAVRGDTVMLGYWNQPEATAQVLRNGWLYTGDGAWMSDDGYLHIVDRMKDMIVSGGENVYSSEVEQALYRHPAVLECAVIGIPDERWGERVHAEVVLRPGETVTAEQLIAHAHTQIAGYKCPKSVTIRSAALPLTAAGKIQKAALREPYWKDATRQVS